MALIDDFGNAIPDDTSAPPSGGAIGAFASVVDENAPSINEGTTPNDKHRDPDRQLPAHQEDAVKDFSTAVSDMVRENNTAAAAQHAGQSVENAAESRARAVDPTGDKRQADAETTRDRLDVFASFMEESDPEGKRKEGASLHGERTDLERRWQEYVDSINRGERIRDPQFEASIQGEHTDLSKREDDWIEVAKKIDTIGGSLQEAFDEYTKARGSLNEWQQVLGSDADELRKAYNDYAATVPDPISPGEYRALIQAGSIRPGGDLQMNTALSDWDAQTNLGPGARLPEYEMDIPLPDPQKPADVLAAFTAAYPNSGATAALYGPDGKPNALAGEYMNRVTAQMGQARSDWLATHPEQIPDAKSPPVIAQLENFIYGTQLVGGVVPVSYAILLANAIAPVAVASFGEGPVAALGARFAKPIEIAIRGGSAAAGGYETIQGARKIKEGDWLGGSLEIAGGIMTAAMGFGLGASVRSALAGTAAAADLGIVPAYARAGGGSVPFVTLEGKGFLGKTGRIGLAAFVEGVPGFVPYTPDALHHPAGFIIDNVERAVRTAIESPGEFWSKTYDLATRNIALEDFGTLWKGIFHQDEETYFRQQGLQRTAQELDPLIGAKARTQIAAAVGSVLLSQMAALGQGRSPLEAIDPFHQFSSVYQNYTSGGMTPEQALDATIKITSNGFAYFLFSINPRNPAYTFLGFPALERVMNTAMLGMGRKVNFDVDAYLSGKKSLVNRDRGIAEMAFGVSVDSSLGILRREAYRDFASSFPEGTDVHGAFGIFTRAAEAYVMAAERPALRATYEDVARTYTKQLTRELNQPGSGSWDYLARLTADGARLRIEKINRGGSAGYAGPMEAGAYFGSMRAGLNDKMLGLSVSKSGRVYDYSSIESIKAQYAGGLPHEHAARLEGIGTLAGLVRDSFALQAGKPIMGDEIDPAKAKKAILAALDGVRTVTLLFATPALAVQKAVSEQVNVMAAGGEGASIKDSAIRLRHTGPQGFADSVLGRFTQSAAAVPEPLLLTEKQTGKGFWGKIDAWASNRIESGIGQTTRHARAGAMKVAADDLVIQRQAHFEALTEALHKAGATDQRIETILNRVEHSPRAVRYNELGEAIWHESRVAYKPPQQGPPTPPVPKPPPPAFNPNAPTPVPRVYPPFNAPQKFPQTPQLPGFQPAPSGYGGGVTASPLAPVHQPPVGIRGIFERMRLLPAVEPRYQPIDVPNAKEISGAFRDPNRRFVRMADGESYVRNTDAAKAELLKERHTELLEITRGLNGDEYRMAVHEFNRQNAFHGVDLPVEGYDSPGSIRQKMIENGQPVAHTFEKLVQERAGQPQIRTKGGTPEDRQRLVQMADRMLAARDAKAKVGETLQAARDDAAARFAKSPKPAPGAEMTPAQRDLVVQLRQAEMRLQKHREQLPVSEEGLRRYSEAAGLAHIPTRQHEGEDLMTHAERVKRLIDDPTQKPQWEQTILERMQALHAKENPGVVSPFARFMGPAPQAAGLPPYPATEDLAGIKNVLRDFGKQRQELERAGLIMADKLNDRAVGDFSKKSQLGELATYVYPFLDFHLNQKRIALTNMARNPLYGAAMLQYLNDNQDEFKRLPVFGPYVADLTKLYTGLQALKWGRERFEYADEVINDETNNPLQKGIKIAASTLVGHGAIAHMFPFADVPLQGALSAITNPVKSDTNYTGGSNWATSLIRYGADRTIGENHPLARDRAREAARWIGNPVGTTFDELGRRAMDAMGIPQKQKDEFGPGWNHAIPEIARAWGWDRNRMQAAIDSPVTKEPQAQKDLAHLKQAYLTQIDKEGISSVVPTPLSRPRGKGESGIYPRAGVETPFDANMEQSFNDRQLARNKQGPGLGGRYMEKAIYEQNYGVGSPESLVSTQRLIDSLRETNAGFPANNRLTEHQAQVRSENAEQNPVRAANIERAYGLGPEFDGVTGPAQRDILRYEDTYKDVRKALSDAGYNKALSTGQFEQATRIAIDVPGGSDYIRGLRELQAAGGSALKTAKDEYGVHHPELGEPSFGADIEENFNKRQEARNKQGAGLRGLYDARDLIKAQYGDGSPEDVAAEQRLMARLRDTTSANFPGNNLLTEHQTEVRSISAGKNPERAALLEGFYADPESHKALLDRSNLHKELFEANPEWRDQYYNQYLGLATPAEKHTYQLAHPELFAALDGIDARIQTDDLINPDLARHRQDQIVAARGFMDPNASLLMKDNVYFDTFTQSQRNSYDAYETFMKTDVAQNWLEIAKRFNGSPEEGGIGGYAAPGGKEWFLAHQAEYNSKKDAYHAGLRKVASDTGVDPFEVVNRIKVAMGEPVLTNASIADLVDSKAGGKGKGHGDGLTSEQRLEAARQRGLAAYQERTKWQHDTLSSFGTSTGRKGELDTVDTVHDINNHTPKADWTAYYGSLTSWEKKQIIDRGGKPSKDADAAAFTKALADAKAIEGQPNLYYHGQKGLAGGIPGGPSGIHTGALDQFAAATSDANAAYSPTGFTTTKSSKSPVSKAVYGSLDEYGQTVRSPYSRSHGGNSRRQIFPKRYHAPKPRGKYVKKGTNTTKKTSVLK